MNPQHFRILPTFILLVTVWSIKAQNDLKLEITFDPQNRLQLQWPGQSNEVASLEWSPDLTRLDWIELEKEEVELRWFDGRWQARDLRPLLGARFYRLRFSTALPNGRILFPPSHFTMPFGDFLSFAGTADAEQSGLILHWDYGDGSTATGPHPPARTYALPGNYVVTLAAINSAGISDPSPATNQIHVLPLIPSDAFGVSLGSTYLDVTRTPRALELISRAGGGWVRLPLTWGRLQPSEMHSKSNRFEFREHDALVSMVRTQRLNVLGMLAYGTQWNSTAPSEVVSPAQREHYPPRDYDAWARYVYGTVSHYKQEIHFWEIWNEPDLGFAGSPGDPCQTGFWCGTAAQYARLLALAYREIKRADPEAQVVLGGLALDGPPGQFNPNFLSEILDDPTHPAGNHFEIAAFHLYGDMREGQRRLDHVRSELSRKNLAHRPIWITEMGHASESRHQRVPGYENGPESQAQYVRDFVPTFFEKGVARLFWFQLNDAPQFTGPFETHGLLDTNLLSKPAYHAFQSVAAAPTLYGVLPADEVTERTVRETIDAGCRRMDVEWARQETAPGVFAFDLLREVVRETESAGLRLFPTLYVGRGWMNHRAPRVEGAKEPRSFPPTDLQSSPDPVHLHSRTYYQFVRRFMEEFRGHFDYIAIENEPNSILYWGGGIVNTNTNAIDPVRASLEYVWLVKTAYKAIKEIDPAVRVIDGGMVTGVWGNVMAKDWLETKARSRDEAIDFAFQYYTVGIPANPEFANVTRDQLADILEGRVQSDFLTNTWPRVITIMDGLAGVVDGFNFHYYESYRWIPQLADWIRDRTSRAPVSYLTPVVCNEIGIRGTAKTGCDPTDPFAPEELDRQARETCKTLVACRVAALPVVTWFSIDTVCATNRIQTDNISLLNLDHTTLRACGEAFRRVTRLLNAHGRSHRTVASGPDLFQYEFLDASARPVLIAAWTENGPMEITLAVPAGFSEVEVTDYLGRETVEKITSETFTITVESPVFIRWR